MLFVVDLFYSSCHVDEVDVESFLKDLCCQDLGEGHWNNELKF